MAANLQDGTMLIGERAFDLDLRAKLGKEAAMERAHAKPWRMTNLVFTLVHPGLQVVRIQRWLR